MWGFILPNQRRQQTTTRMHAFHIPHWRMNKRPCLFHLDWQRHAKKKLETSQEVRSWRQGSLKKSKLNLNWAILKNPGGGIETGRTPAVLHELKSKNWESRLICELETNIGPTEPYPHHQWWIHGMPRLVRANLWPPGPARRHGELLAFKSDRMKPLKAHLELSN